MYLFNVFLLFNIIFNLKLNFKLKMGQKMYTLKISQKPVVTMCITLLL